MPFTKSIRLMALLQCSLRKMLMLKLFLILLLLLLLLFIEGLFFAIARHNSVICLSCSVSLSLSLSSSWIWLFILFCCSASWFVILSFSATNLLINLSFSSSFVLILLCFLLIFLLFFAGKPCSNHSEHFENNSLYDSFDEFVKYHSTNDLFFNCQLDEQNSTILFDCDAKDVEKVNYLIKEKFPNYSTLKVDLSNEIYVSDRFYGLSMNLISKKNNYLG